MSRMVGMTAAKETPKQSRALWISQYKALKSKEENFRRDVFNHFQNNPRLVDMKDLILEMTSIEGLGKQKQLEEKKECLEDIQDISKRVSSLKRLTMENKIALETTTQDEKDEILRRIKSTMERIENQCIVFKQTRREILQTLNTEEKMLLKDITAIESKIDDPNWMKDKEDSESIFDNPEKMKAVKQYIEKRENMRVPQEVIDYDNFLAKHGGLNGGWDEIEHSQFVQLRQKNPDQQIFMSKAVDTIRTKTIIEIQEHESFYRQLLTLQNEKKRAIQKWKEEKQKKREEQIELEAEDKTKQLEKEEERLRQEAKRQKTLTKVRLQTWKLEKEQYEKERKEYEEKMKQETKFKILEEERIRRQKEKEMIEHYRVIKEHKSKEKNQKIVEELTKKSRPPSPMEIARVKEREEQYLKRANELRMRKEVEAKEKEQRLNKLKEKVKVEVTMDTNRLLRPTQAQFNREVEIREYQAQPKSADPRMGLDVRMISHRSVPSWRK